MAGNEGRLTITFDGHTLFDDVVDEVECNHSVDRRIDQFDFEPMTGTVTLTGTYKVEPEPFAKPSPKTLAAIDAALSLNPDVRAMAREALEP